MIPPLHKVQNAWYSTSLNSDSLVTVVLLHGNSSSAEVWQHQLQSDSLSRFSLVALDLPGHGGSHRDTGYSVPEVVETLKENIGVYKKVVVVGHSLGGHLADRPGFSKSHGSIGRFRRTFR